MIAVFAVFVAVGIALGLWGEASEQRRLSRMARDCKKERTL